MEEQDNILKSKIKILKRTLRKFGLRNKNQAWVPSLSPKTIKAWITKSREIIPSRPIIGFHLTMKSNLSNKATRETIFRFDLYKINLKFQEALENHQESFQEDYSQ